MPIILGKQSYVHHPSPFTNLFNGLVRIGNFTGVAAGVRFLGGNSSHHPSVAHPEAVANFPFVENLGLKEYWPNTDAGPITLGNDVWIGTSAIILGGVTIADGAIVGAGCVVAKDVPAYAVVVGKPQRLVRYRFDEETIGRLLRIGWWHWDLSVIREHMAKFRNIRDFLQAFDPITSG